MPLLILALAMIPAGSDAEPAFAREARARCLASVAMDSRGQCWAFDIPSQSLIATWGAAAIQLEMPDLLVDVDLCWDSETFYLLDRERGVLRAFRPSGATRFVHDLTNSFPRLRSAASLDVSDGRILITDPVQSALYIQSDGQDKVIPLQRHRLDLADACFIPDGFAVLDRGHGRFLFLDAAGDVVSSHGHMGSAPGSLRRPSTITFAYDMLWVTDSGNDRIQVFDSNGSLASIIGRGERVLHEGQGGLHEPNALAVHRDQTSTELTVLESLEDRVQLFSTRVSGSQPQFMNRSPHLGTELAVSENRLVLADQKSGEIRLFDLSGEVPIHVSTWGPLGNGQGAITGPTSIVFDGKGSLWVLDPSAGKILRFDITFERPETPRFDPDALRVSRIIDVARLTLGSPPIVPSHLRWDPHSRRLTVYDARRAEIVAIAANGIIEDRVFALDGAHLLDYQWHPQGRALAVLVADTPMIRVFNHDGQLISTAGTRGLNRIELLAPRRLAFAGEDLFAVDPVLGRVTHIRWGTGDWLGEWGIQGYGDGLVWKPTSVVAHRGNLLVNDYGNHRIQGFERDGTWLCSFGTGRSVSRQSAVSP